jgi:hypothetical protein
MRTQAVLVALLLAVTALAAAPLLRADGPASRVQWEYRRIRYADLSEVDPVMKALDDAGKDGWEIAAYDHATRDGVAFVLKRAKQP